MNDTENTNLHIIQDRSGKYKRGIVIGSKELVNDYILQTREDSSIVMNMTLFEQISHISSSTGLRVATVTESGKARTCYISLPISGYDINERICVSEKAKLRAAKILGYKTPMELLNISTPFEINSHLSLDEYSRQMGNDIEAILDSDVVYFCKGWQNSKGCRAEYEVAQIYCKTLIFE